MLRMAGRRTLHSKFSTLGDDVEPTREDFQSNNAGKSVSWYNPPRYKTKGEKAIHQRLKKKLEEKKNQKK